MKTKSKPKRPLAVRETPAPYFDHIKEADRIQLAALRRLGPTGRLNQMFEMYEFARNLISGVLTQNHPDWSKARIAAEVRKRMTGGL